MLHPMRACGAEGTEISRFSAAPRIGLHFRSLHASDKVQRISLKTGLFAIFSGIRRQTGLGVVQNASSRLVDRTSPLVQADSPDRKRPRDAEHRVVGRLFAQTE